MQKDETKSEILIGLAWGNSGFISRRGVVCAAARQTWLDARCVFVRRATLRESHLALGNSEI
jgi:hypothetical protein